MKQCVLVFLLLCLAGNAAAQEEDKSVNELVRLTSSATPITSTQELPLIVQRGIGDILKTRMGTIADSLSLSAGEIIYSMSVRGDGLQPDSSWAVPMYNLRFLLANAALGIQSYELELRVDEKGRLMFINWPRSGYSDVAVLASFESVLQYATTFAKRRKFFSARSRMQLRFYGDRDKMVWVFQYPVKDLSRVQMLHSVEVDWLGPELIKEYMDSY